MPEDRVTKPIRVYRGDEAMIARMARSMTIGRSRRATPADVVHALLAPVRKQEQAKERGK